MPRIYFPELAQISNLLFLPTKQAQHVRVLRLNPQDHIELFDGKGLIATSQITKIDKKSVELELLSKTSAKPAATFPIHLAMSYIRNEQMDWVIQKSVELGVKEITPIMAERSQGRLNQEQAEKKQAHWFEVMVSAAEQSHLNFLPTLNPACTFEAFLASGTASGMKLILDPYATSSLKAIKPTHRSATLFIGPEGGFSDNEVSKAKGAGFMGIQLHEQILRAETAAITGIAMTQFCFS